MNNYIRNEIEQRIKEMEKDAEILKLYLEYNKDKEPYDEAIVAKVANTTRARVRRVTREALMDAHNTMREDITRKAMTEPCTEEELALKNGVPVSTVMNILYGRPVEGRYPYGRPEVPGMEVS